MLQKIMGGGGPRPDLKHGALKGTTLLRAFSSNAALGDKQVCEVVNPENGPCALCCLCCKDLQSSHTDCS